ncbi:MAG: BolA family transcriptional regulator [Candidatus Marinimicrobia bacterium]|nr:BolA family transcriptional regulator [Candidatus Neomarinimicrobiota bacterium]|tara:strand:+ start:30863 stop:31087 length:225 start_codon:yes stop_codon:yes gene_type:complete
MEVEEVKNLIENGLSGSIVKVKDLKGTGDHFSVEVIWSGFEDMTLIEQHQKVYKTLGKLLTNEIHALQLRTAVN